MSFGLHKVPDTGLASKKLANMRKNKAQTRPKPCIKMRREACNALATEPAGARRRIAQPFAPGQPLIRTPKLNFCVGGERPPARDTDFVACSRKTEFIGVPAAAGCDGRVVEKCFAARTKASCCARGRVHSDMALSAPPPSATFGVSGFNCVKPQKMQRHKNPQRSRQSRQAGATGRSPNPAGPAKSPPWNIVMELRPDDDICWCGCCYRPRKPHCRN